MSSSKSKKKSDLKNERELDPQDKEIVDNLESDWETKMQTMIKEQISLTLEKVLESKRFKESMESSPPSSPVYYSQEEKTTKLSKPLFHEDEVKNKRSANEVTVLNEILLHVEQIEEEENYNESLQRIKSIINKRVFLLSLAEKINWGNALAYVDLFPDSLQVDHSKVKEAMEYCRMMSNLQRKSPSYSNLANDYGSNPSNEKGNEGKSTRTGACFRCGKAGHWAAECKLKPQRKK